MHLLYKHIQQYFTISLLLGSLIIVCGQQRVIEKKQVDIIMLKNQIVSEQNDSIKLQLYKTYISNLYYDYSTQPDNYESIDEMYQLASKEGNTEMMAFSKYHIGLFFFDNNEFDESLVHWKKAVELYEVLKDYSGVAYTASFIGEAYTTMGNYEKSMEALYEGLQAVENTNSKRMHARLLSKIGVNYKNLNQLDKAQSYFQQAIAIATPRNIVREIAFAKRNLGDLELKKKQHEDAIYYYEESKDLYLSINNLHGEARCNQVLSEAFTEINDLKKARFSLAISDSLYQRLKYVGELNKNNLLLSGILFKEKDFATSKSLAQNSLQIAKQNKNYNNELRSLKLIFKNQYALGQIKQALDTHIELDKRKEEVYSFVTEKNIESKRLEYAIAKNKSLTEQNRITEANLNATNSRLENNTRIIVTISLISILFLIGLLFLTKQGSTIKKNNQVLSAQNSLIENQNKEITDIANELSSSNKEISRINENLETIIKERTRDLEEKNKLLLKYSQMNSHDVRAPLARILGLVDLLKESARTKDQQILIESLLQSADEMDQVVKTMNSILHKSEKTT
ncbi:tetratricopeptide repeat protein [Spongiivirga citrea]|uniref:histidine kinase n=1 Tax=Spongiivirga citrea TaxID=1481457 RepID=A0A6M0CGR1_9FLAO|nr:tetratricopeptide repeat protein [Spongiivirga citrea]NER16682.1 hypothetical protein [Spongiivirga citrea]